MSKDILHSLKDELTNFAINSNFVKKDEIDKLIKHAKNTDTNLYDLLKKDGYISDEKLLSHLNKKYSISSELNPKAIIPDIKNFANEVDAEKFVRSKYEFTPKLDRPKESYTKEEMEKILNEKPPEKKAKGGAIGLDYLTGQEPPKNGYAGGGRIGFEKGSIPEEEDEEPSEEYIKSREAGRFKYSFDVQGPDSRTRKSGLPGRTNPKDYGLGITYLSNPSNETAPEIRVGASRRGAGIEIRKRFKDGGLGYLVGE